MAVPCKRSEPVLTQFKNGFEFRKLNRKICGELTEKGNMMITFIRLLSKEEAELLKDVPAYPMSYVIKGKILVNIVAMSPESMGDLAHILMHITDNLEDFEYSPNPLFKIHE